MHTILKYSTILILLVFMLFSAAAQNESSETGYIKDGMLVVRVKDEFRSVCSDRQIAHPQIEAMFQEIGGVDVKRMFPDHQKPEKMIDAFGNPLTDLSLLYVLEFSDDLPVQQVAHLLIRSGIFEYAEPYIIPELMYIPDDPQITNQYYLTNIRAYEAWDIWRGDTNYVVGITDTGYEFNHPDLVNAVKYNYGDTIDGIDNDNDGYVDNFMGWNLGQNNNNPQYVAVGHGIHVSGIAGATADNTFGMVGVGFLTKLLPVKIDNQSGALTMSYQGIVYAADHGADIINCSWGSTFSPGQFGQDIINYATFNRNCLVVAAAGNSNNQRMFYPCSFKHVLCVAASKVDDLKWENSSYCRRVDISAPGSDIYSTWVNGTFISSGGTSMASPAVAGAAALVWSYFPQFSPLQLAQHLKNTVDNIDTLQGNQLYVHKLGYGRLNMFRALTDTLKPAIKLDNVFISDNNDQVFTMNDTLNLQCDFINYLAPSQNLKITMRCSSPYVQVLDSVFNAGIQPQMANFSNPPQGFRIKLLQGIPSSHDIEIQFEYQDIQYSGYDYYFTTVNIDFLDLNVNNIATTITSKGILGYNDNYNFQQGIGFQFENSSSLISCAGLMIGRANNQVSDNMYGFNNAFDSDFYPVSSVAYINPPVSGDMQISSEFNDSGAGVQKLNVRVLQNHFAWNSAGNENFIICEYNIINQESSALTNVFTGMFADWELNIRSLNRASTNTAQRFGFAYSTDSSWFAAIQLLTPGNFQHYAIDNDGHDGSVNLNDGFSTTEKFMVLSNTRLTSGNGPFGNNVSNVVSSGPYSIPSGDTLHVAFALHVAYTSADLQQSVTNAQQSWNNMLNVGVASADLNAMNVYPNPFTEDFIVSMYPEAGLHSLKITDLNGRVVFQSETYTEREIRVSASGLQAGMYLLHINGNESIVKKIIKLQTQE